MRFWLLHVTFLPIPVWNFVMPDFSKYTAIKFNISLKQVFKFHYKNNGLGLLSRKLISTEYFKFFNEKKLIKTVHS